MYIPNVPKNYISDPSMITRGMDIWLVGQGGITNVTKPELLGMVIQPNARLGSGNEPIEAGSFIFIRPNSTCPDSRSYRDSHVIHQEYNNWYLCASAEDAQVIYEFLKNTWDSNPKYKEARQQFIAQCSFSAR